MTRVAIPPEGAANPAIFAWGRYGGAMAEAGFAFSRAVYRHSRLSHRESEAARMRTAQINGCQVCKGWRGAVDTPALLAAAGEADGPSVVDNGAAPDEAFYQAIADWRGATLFSPRERLALEFAEKIAADAPALAQDEGFWSRAKAAFSDAEIVDLTLSTVSWLAMGRATHVLGLDTVCPFETPAAVAAE